jgi:hypothetical protein
MEPGVRRKTNLQDDKLVLAKILLIAGVAAREIIR